MAKKLILMLSSIGMLIGCKDIPNTREKASAVLEEKNQLNKSSLQDILEQEISKLNGEITDVQLGLLPYSLDGGESGYIYTFQYVFVKDRDKKYHVLIQPFQQPIIKEKALICYQKLKNNYITSLDFLKYFVAPYLTFERNVEVATIYNYNPKKDRIFPTSGSQKVFGEGIIIGDIPCYLNH